MSNVVMPETRTFEAEGVKIEYLTFSTLKSHVVEKIMRAEFERAAPTSDDPNGRTLRNEVVFFFRAAPAIVSVTLPDTPPLWGVFLKRAVEANDWLEDPVKDFKTMERFAPTMTMLYAYDGYNATREKVLVAPDELKKPLLPVDEFDETLSAEEKEAKKKTMPIAGRSSTGRSSTGRAKRSAAPTPRRK